MIKLINLSYFDKTGVNFIDKKYHNTKTDFKS